MRADNLCTAILHSRIVETERQADKEDDGLIMSKIGQTTLDSYMYPSRPGRPHWRKQVSLPLTVVTLLLRPHLRSYNGCLDVRVKINCQNCSVLYCVLKLCTVMSTLRWAVLAVPWIGDCLTGPILLCLDLFVFMFVYFLFIFLLHVFYYCNAVGWTWWDWSLIFRTLSPFSALTLLVESFDP